MTKLIPLTRNKKAIVDDDMYEYLTQWKWHYAGRYARRVIVNGSRIEVIEMHHAILEAPDGFEIDHKDGNTLNNTIANLRICTSGQNKSNRKGWSSTGFKGVFLETRHNPKKQYRARIYINNRCIHLGSFYTPEEAARAYDMKAIELFGEFARTNF